MVGSRAAVLLALAHAGAGAGAAHADDRGRQLFEGGHPALASASLPADHGAPVPPEQAACSACHRPSGLGSFEGGSEVPPISAGTLAVPWDPATTRRYAPSARLRVRPAYDAAALQRLLAEGRTPDGLQMSTLMPRYRVSLADSGALLAHLNGLGSDATPGVDDETVHFATVVAGDEGAAREADLLAVLGRFIADRNAATRAEGLRRASAQRNEQVMYRRWRRWSLHVWRLTGPPEGWPQQLAAHAARQPVFALLSGAGGPDWAPVHAFCESRRMPCLFPVTAQPGAAAGFYNAYFDGGLPAQARWLAGDMSGSGGRVQVLADAGAAGAAVAAALRGGGLAVAAGPRWDGAEVVVSPLAPSALARLLPPPGAAGPRRIVLLGGTGAAAAAPELAPWRAQAEVEWVVQQRSDAGALARARAWWRARGLQPGDEGFAARVLFAATTALESLVHVDERFSREYCLEKLEHNLENMPPLTAYPRLALGPNRRVAAHEVWREPAR